MSAEEAPQRPVRALLAAGTEIYRHGAAFTDGLDNLDVVPGELRSIVDALTGRGYTPWSRGTERYLLNPEVEELREAVRAAARAAPLVVLYYTGHGLKPERSPFYLLTADSEEDRLEGTALEPSQFLTLVQRMERGRPAAEQPQVLVVLDCCFSGAGGGETLRDALQDLGNPNVWVLASAGALEWAVRGVFATAFTSALNKRPSTGHSQEFVSLDWIVGEVNAALKAVGADQTARLVLPHGETTGIYPGFFANEEQVPGVAGLTVEDQEWVSRLRGASGESTTAGFYVTGRTGRVRVVEDLARWMRDPDGGGLAVVTGSPGCGKSAMLALPVLLSDSQRRDAALAGAGQESLASRAIDLFDGLSVLGAYARGMDIYKVTDAISEYLGRFADSPEELLQDLQKHPETSSRIVVIDALDEARDPRRLLTGLLLPLARQPGLRVVVGARRQVLPPLDATSLVIDLDSDDYQDPQALSEYARQLLVAAHEPNLTTPYRDGAESLAATVAAGIAAKATSRPFMTGRAQSFLLAQLMARAVRGRPQIIDVTRAGWTDELPAGIAAAFEEDLGRLKRRESTAHALLTALAWAKGPGLPWESIWVPVARALAARNDNDPPPLDDDDVRWLLNNAGAYVVEDLGPSNRSVFRPFHGLLTAYLTGQPSQQPTADDPTTGDAWRQRCQQAEKVITAALLDTIPYATNGKADWELAHPYLRTYIAQHAHNAGPETFAELVRELDYLAVADPTTLTPLLTPTDPALRSVARAYRRALPLFGGNCSDNMAYLQEAVVAETGAHPTGQCITPTYRTVMARIHHDESQIGRASCRERV